MRRMKLIPEFEYNLHKQRLNSSQSEFLTPRRGPKHKVPQVNVSSLLGTVRPSWKSTQQNKYKISTPTTVQNLLFQDATRRQIQQKKKQRAIPVLVKNVSSGYESHVTQPKIKLESPQEFIKKEEEDDDEQFKFVSAPWLLKHLSGDPEIAVAAFDLLQSADVDYNKKFELVIEGETFPTSNFLKVLHHMLDLGNRSKRYVPLGYHEAMQQVTYYAKHNSINPKLIPLLEPLEEQLQLSDDGDNQNEEGGEDDKDDDDEDNFRTPKVSLAPKKAKAVPGSAYHSLRTRRIKKGEKATKVKK